MFSLWCGRRHTVNRLKSLVCSLPCAFACVAWLTVNCRLLALLHLHTTTDLLVLWVAISLVQAQMPYDTRWFFFPCIEFYRQPRNLRRSWKKILKPLQWDHLRRKPQPIMKIKNKNWKSLLQKRVYEIFKVLLSDHFADRNVHLSCSVLAVGMGQIIFFFLHIDIYNTDWEFGSL